jgi:hypothetical protein
MVPTPLILFGKNTHGNDWVVLWACYLGNHYFCIAYLRPEIKVLQRIACQKWPQVYQATSRR